MLSKARASSLQRRSPRARFCGKKIRSYSPPNGTSRTTVKLRLGSTRRYRDIYDLQTSSSACAFCSTPLRNHSPLHLPCSASASSCPAMFCNRLCRTQSERVHPLLCPARNPASAALLKFARHSEWMALHALAQCTSRLLLAAQRDDGTFDPDFHVLQSLAELGMEERFRALRCVCPFG